VEDRLSELEDKVGITEKSNEYIEKSMKNYVLNIQELYDFTKRPKYLSWALKKKGVQTKSIRSIFNKIIAENSPNLQKEMFIQVQETLEPQTDKTKIQSLHGIS
jgi:hypothetical protein